MAIISTLSALIRFILLPTYYMCWKRSSPKMHEAIKKWVCRMADPFAHFLFRCKRTVVVPCAFSLCELPREWDTPGCFRIFPLFSNSFPPTWDHIYCQVNYIQNSDSLPLAWDRPAVIAVSVCDNRFIPTHVGCFITIAVLSNFTPRFIPT